MAKEETNVGVRYERKDIWLRWVLALLLGAMCFVAILLFVIWRLFWLREGIVEAAKSPYAVAPRSATQLPPEPRLEQIDRLAGVAASDVNKRQTAQERILNSYGPTADKGFVHVPIRQAIRAVAGQLPVRHKSPGETAEDNGLIDAGESNSGRMFREEPR
jgi:hypothetical protein